MLSVSNVSKTYAGRTLFSGVSFHINRGDKIGLIGPNGAGKSTLFSLLLREITPDDGRVTMEKGLDFGFLPQESAPIDDVSVLELATSHVPEHSAWEAEPKAKRILKGLAFRESDFHRNARTLSGGWVMRAHLANGAVHRASAKGHKVAMAHLTHLHPFPKNLGEVVKAYPKVLVPEMNLGQLSLLLRGHFLVDAQSVTKMKGLPFTAGEIERAILAELEMD